MRDSRDMVCCMRVLGQCRSSKALLAVLFFVLLTVHRRLALDALYGRQPVLGDPELREVLRPGTSSSVNLRWAFSGFPFFGLALNTSLIVLLEILGTGNIKSNMPRYSAQIRQYRDRQKQMPFFRRTFPASDNPLNINNRIQKAATARYTSGYGVGSFPARVRPEKVEETLLMFFSVTGVEWC